MAETETMNDVADSQVAVVVRDYKSEGATVTQTKNADGTWTVVATFPDSTGKPT
jgi:hypothetical protein